MAEGQKQSAILAAEAQKEAAIKKAEGEAAAIKTVQEAKAAGIRMVKEAGADDALIRLRRLEALEKVADGQSTKLILPSDLSTLAGIVSTLKEAAK